MAQQVQDDIQMVGQIQAVPTMLEVVRSITGMGFVAVSRITEDRWIACSVLDQIGLGLKPGSEVQIETTICHEIEQSRKPVVISNVAEDAVWCNHPGPALYGFQSYISVPIILADGSVFGTLCALDRKPVDVRRPELVGMFRLFAELIAKHIDINRKLATSESALSEESALTKEREQALHMSEARYRDVVETQTELVCRFLPDTTVTFVNDAYCRYFDKPRHDLIGRKFLELLPNPEQIRVRELINATIEGRHSGPSDQRNIQSDGSIRWVQWVNHVLRSANGEIEIQGIGRDITEQKRAQEQLERSREELRLSQAQIRRLAGRLMKAQEEERRHIARELHDDLNQRIASISISLSNIKHRLPPDDDLVRQLTQVQERANEIANDIRTLCHALRPVVLEQAGLGVALQSMIEEFNNSQPVRFDLRLPEDGRTVSDEVAICLFRIAQESLRNITKHSGASHADVELSRSNGFISLQISDDGCGFEPNNAHTRSGLGLISMAERVRELQGTFEVRTKPGEGTSLRATVPTHPLS